MIQAHNGPLTVGLAFPMRSRWYSDKVSYRVILYGEGIEIKAFSKREVYKLFKSHGAKKIRKRGC
jgi:hypothetical protein